MSKLNLDSRVPDEYSRATFSDIIRTICGQLNPLSEGRLSARYNAQATVPSGTATSFAVGDFVPDSNCTMTSGSVRLGWVCVSSGTPGTFQEARILTAGAATQAEQETGASTTTFTSPGRQHFHPSAAKAWANFTAAVVNNGSYNITSITDSGTGNWRVAFTVAFSSANYAVLATPYTSSDNFGLSYNSGGGQVAEAVQIACVNSGTNALTDPDVMMFAAFGDQ